MTEKMVRRTYILCIICILSLYFAAGVFYIQRHKIYFGEADSYMMPAISLLNHGTMVITEEDMAQAETDYPEFYPWIRQRFDDGWMVETVDGGRNPYYFCTYSVACIPLKLIFKAIGYPQVLAFPFTNLFLLICSSVLICSRLRTTRVRRLVLMMFLLVNPVFCYIPWQSAEVFIFCMVSLSIMHHVNGEYNRSAFLLSLAGTLNVTVMVYGFILIVDYFAGLFAKYRVKRVMSIIRNDIPGIIKFGCCFLIVFAPFIHNMLYIGEANRTFHMFQTAEIWGRFKAYLFDLNLGIFPYYPLLLPGGVIAVVAAVKLRKVKCILLTVALFGIVVAYSFAIHINCGMEGISRYGSWTTPFLIFICALYYPWKAGRVNVLWKSISGTAIFASLVIVAVLVNASEYRSCFEMSKQAQIVLEYAPQLYNPLFSTFTFRATGAEESYAYMSVLPVIYRNDEAEVRKILMSANEIPFLKSIVYGDEKSLNYLDKKLSEHEEDEKVFYINVPHQYTLFAKYYEDERGFQEEEIVLCEEVSHRDDLVGVLQRVIEPEPDAYYRVEVEYEGELYSKQFHCDFYGGASYDRWEQETVLKPYDTEKKLASCVLYSGDTELAEGDIYFRIINVTGDTSSDFEVRKIILTKLKK